MNAREAALEIVKEVRDGGYLNIVLKRKVDGLSAEDRRFAAALSYAVLENYIYIDHVIDSFTEGKRIHKEIRDVLRLGTAQLLFMDKVPESAAVNESVAIVAKGKKRQLKGFVNAVLRNIARNGKDISVPSFEEDAVKHIVLSTSTPEWIVKKYIDEYDAAFAKELLSWHKKEALTCVRPNAIRISRKDFEQELSDMGCEYVRGEYCDDAYYIKNMVAPGDTALFREGKLAVMGEASMLAVRAANVRGERVLDVCAAPGGKSAYASALGAQSITSWDLHSHRVELMKKNFARLGVNGGAFVNDASVPEPTLYGKFSRVIVDAPCSALGLMHRKPDIKLNKQDEIANISEIQADILETCSRYVKPGGRLIYCTCTISKAENQANREAFLKRNVNFVPAPLGIGSLGKRANDTEIQFFPHIDGIDGFYIAAFRREK